MTLRFIALLPLLGLTLATMGCASTKTSNTARTAKEQMLLSNAVDQSLDKVDFTPLHAQKVYLDEKYLDCVDKAYIVGSMRHRVLRAGGHLVSSPEDAEIVMEVRSGGVGTDTSEAFLGTPEIALPGMLTIPEIRLAERKAQFGYSKLGMVLYDAKTRHILGDGGVALAQSNDSNAYFMGIGPFQSGTLRQDVSRAKSTNTATQRRALPTTVAFGTRSELNESASVQFASDQKTAE
ncbi:MAG: hypothetical protein RIK87_22455 [Fuerstiella sp.]